MGVSNVKVRDAGRYLNGNEQGMRDVGTAFTAVTNALEDLHRDMQNKVRGFLAGFTWRSRAADRFGDVNDALVRFIGTVAEATRPYGGALTGAAGQYHEAVRSVTNADPDAIADAPLNSLAATYRDAATAMKEIPTEPAKVTGDHSDDPPDDDDEETDDPEKPGGPEETPGGPAGGGGGPETGTEEPATDTGSGEPLSGLGDSDSGGSGPGSEPTDELGDSGTEEGSGDSGSGSGVGPGGVLPPLTDSNRALPGAPTATSRDGKTTGIDVDGDGRPDLGLDGKPLRGPDGELLDPDKLITANGLTGIDVNGDGIPDIGVDGEILPGAPIVEGPDGTIGIDVDEDGIPDVGISGQILPDAPIVRTDDVRGVDVNGDGIPDLGMDRRPLPYATLVTVDGVTGVDVNGDGIPDIGLKGEILDGAPMVTGPNGLVGVDVNSDGKPDIAAIGGLKADRDVAAGTTRPAGLAPALSATGQTVSRGYEVTDPPTSLAAAAARSPALASPRSSAGGTTDFTSMPGMFFGGAAGMGLGGTDTVGLDGTSSWAGVTLVESGDTWLDEGPRTAVLGRDKPTTGWEEPRR